MKILQLIYEAPGSPFGYGGAGVRAFEIYRRLASRHDITLLCMKYPGARDGEADGIRYTFVGTESGNLTRSVLSYTLKAADYVRKFGNTFDVVVENFLPSTPFFARFLTKTPVALQVQGVMERHALRKFNPFYSLPMSLVETFYPRLYDRFIFVSEVTKEKVLSRARRMTDFSPVIPNGINKELLNGRGGEEDYILFLSRIDIYTKGLDLLLHAFEKIAGEFPDTSLVLAGYEFDPFETLTSGLPDALRRRVRYAGFVSGEEKFGLLAGAKFFVLPSRHESSPISILEAAACGKAVLVSDIPELKHVEENGFGISFSSGSSHDLMEKMRLLLGDESGRFRMGAAGRAYAKDFMWDSIAARFEEALTAVKGSTHGRGRSFDRT